MLIVNQDGIPYDRETLEKIEKKNPDGIGMLNLESYTIIKGLTLDQVLEARFPHVVHFRYRTSGKISNESIHPFTITKGHYLFHNGTIAGFGDVNTVDTEEMAFMLVGCSKKARVKWLEKTSKGRFVLVDCNKKEITMVGPVNEELKDQGTGNIAYANRERWTNRGGILYSKDPDSLNNEKVSQAIRGVASNKKLNTRFKTRPKLSELAGKRITYKDGRFDRPKWIGTSTRDDTLQLVFIHDSMRRSKAEGVYTKDIYCLSEKAEAFGYGILMKGYDGVLVQRNTYSKKGTVGDLLGATPQELEELDILYEVGEKGSNYDRKVIHVKHLGGTFPVWAYVEEGVDMTYMDAHLNEEWIDKIEEEEKAIDIAYAVCHGCHELGYVYDDCGLCHGCYEDVRKNNEEVDKEEALLLEFGG